MKTRLAGLGCLRGRRAECELKHCIDEGGRGLQPRVTGRRKLGVKGGCNAAGPPSHGQEQGGPAADFGRIHFRTG
jgi:hypothetical protein